VFVVKDGQSVVLYDKTKGFPRWLWPPSCCWVPHDHHKTTDADGGVVRDPFFGAF
jgi:hypothetical protein